MHTDNTKIPLIRVYLCPSVAIESLRSSRLKPATVEQPYEARLVTSDTYCGNDTVGVATRVRWRVRSRSPRRCMMRPT